MPVTPFHFGIGLLGKGVLPARISLSAFVVSQIVIDLETAYFLFVVREWPVHRWAHTLSVGTFVGLGVGLAWATVGRLWRGNADDRRSLASELAVEPFRPFLEGNPFLGVLPLAHLHLLCVAMAAVGAGLLIRRHARRARPRSSRGSGRR